MLEPGGWVNVALPKGVLRAQLVEIQGERCCCVFEDGKKAWVATSTVTSLGARPSGPGPTVSRPPSPASARSISNRWRAALIVGAGVVVVTGAALFALSKRRPAPTPAASAAPALSDPVPTRLRPVVAGITLPLVDDGLDLDLDSDGLANVAIDHRAVYVGEEQVAETEPFRAADRPQRVDKLFERLKAAREVWKTAHVGAEFRGVVQLWVHDETSAQVVKSVAQTAAFAGYPNWTFVLRRRSAPRELRRVNVDATVPGPPNSPKRPTSGRLLAVVLRADDQVELAWMGAGLEPPIERTVPAASLGASIVQLWNERPPGVDLIPERWEQAALSVPNTVPFRKVAHVLEGLGAARVKLAVTQYQEAWTFDVTLKVNVAKSARKLAEDELPPPMPHVTLGVPVSSGRLDREAVQKTMRTSFGELRACYATSLAKNPKLRGRLQLKFVIERNGHVSHAQVILDSTLHDEQLGSCSLDLLKQLTFPWPGSAPVNVLYPILLEPPR